MLDHYSRCERFLIDFFWFISQQIDGPNPFRLQLPGHLSRGQLTIDILATRHCHGIVIQHLIGNIDFGRDRGSHRQVPRMKISTITEIYKTMLLVGEMTDRTPRHAFTAHLRKRLGAPIHPDRHVVASYSCHGLRSFRHFSRCVMRTARTKPGLTINRCLMTSPFIRALLQIGKSLFDTPLQRVIDGKLE